MHYEKDSRFSTIEASSLGKFLADHKDAKYVAVDTETYYDSSRPDLLCKFIEDTPQNYPFIATIAFNALSGYKVYINSDTVAILREYLNAPGREIVGFNLDYDLWMLRNAGIEVTGRVHDVMILHHLINEEDMYNGKYVRSLKDCSVKYISEDANKFEILVDESRMLLACERGCPKAEISYKDVDDRWPDLMTDYASSDPMLTMGLFHLWYPLVDKWGLRQVYGFEMGCIPVIHEIERAGHMVSDAEISKLKAELTASLEDCTTKIYAITGYEFNVNSGDELIEAYRRMGVNYRYRNDEGNLSVDENHLSLLLPDVFTELVLQYRADSKMLNTYVKNLEFYRQSDGRIHPTFWQTGARTGRFSSSNPNFQNYPKEDKRIRRCFVPTPGYTLVYFDYKAQEFRLLAHYANETRLIQMIEAGYDVHSATASLMFNIPIDEVTKVDRAKGKTGNFSAVYGIGNAAYASNLGDKIDTDAYKRAQTILAREGYKPWQMPTKDVILSRITDPLEIEDIEYIYAPETFKMINHAKDVKAKYFKELPNIKQFLDTTRKEVAAQGFIRLWSGRIKHYNDPKTEAYKGVNALIQGGCGDIMKSRLPQVAHLLKPTHSRLVNIIHDEIVVEVRNDELWLIPKIKDLMTIRDFKVTIDCDVELSTTNWAEKREWEDATEEAGIHQTA